MLGGRALVVVGPQLAGARALTIAARHVLAKEALGVADTQERLDRNREGTGRWSYAVVGPRHVEVVSKLLYATYHPDEPLTKHLGLCTGLNSLGEVDRKVEKLLAKNLTLLAYTGEGVPVGVAVNNACMEYEMDKTLEEALAEVEASYRPIQAIHHQLRQANQHIYKEIGTNKLLAIRMVGVEPECRGQGIATNLIRRSILLAGCLGFSGIKAEATGKFGRKAFATVGMIPANSIRYADFEFNGEKPFAEVPNGETEIVFMKKKFFQSALKHIL